MRRIEMHIRLPETCWSSVVCIVVIRWLAAVVPVATCLIVPESALADGAIDTIFRPNFMLGGWIIALAFLGLSLLSLKKAIINRRMAAAAERWPTTAGTVISVDVIKCAHESEISFDYFVPQVRYEYDANGVRRQGSVIRIGLDDIDYLKEKKARAHIALYPVGTTIPVRFDPQNPEHAVIEIGQRGLNRAMLAGAAFASLGLAALIIAISGATVPIR